MEKIKIIREKFYILTKDNMTELLQEQGLIMDDVVAVATTDAEMLAKYVDKDLGDIRYYDNGVQVHTWNDESPDIYFPNKKSMKKVIQSLAVGVLIVEHAIDKDAPTLEEIILGVLPHPEIYVVLTVSHIPHQSLVVPMGKYTLGLDKGRHLITKSLHRQVKWLLEEVEEVKIDENVWGSKIALK